MVQNFKNIYYRKILPPTSLPQPPSSPLERHLLYLQTSTVPFFFFFPFCTQMVTYSIHLFGVFIFITLFKNWKVAPQRGRWMEPSGVSQALQPLLPSRVGDAPEPHLPAAPGCHLASQLRAPRVVQRGAGVGRAARRPAPAPASVTSAPEPGIPAPEAKAGRWRRLELVSRGLSAALGTTMSESSASGLPPGRPSRQPFIHQGRAAGTGFPNLRGDSGSFLFVLSLPPAHPHPGQRAHALTPGALEWESRPW